MGCEDSGRNAWLLRLYEELKRLYDVIGGGSIQAAQARYRAYKNAVEGGGCEELGRLENPPGTILKCGDAFILMSVSGERHEKANVDIHSMFGVGVWPGVIVYLNDVPRLNIEAGGRRGVIELRSLMLAKGPIKGLGNVLSLAVDGRVTDLSENAPIRNSSLIIMYVKIDSLLKELDYVSPVAVNMGIKSRDEMSRILCENRGEIEGRAYRAITLIRELLGS
jgi:hypothetical protein